MHELKFKNLTSITDYWLSAPNIPSDVHLCYVVKGVMFIHGDKRRVIVLSVHHKKTA